MATFQVPCLAGRAVVQCRITAYRTGYIPALMGDVMRNLKLKVGLAVGAGLLLLHTGYAQPNAAAVPMANTAGVYAGTSTFYLFPGPKASKPNHVFGAVSQEGTGYFLAVPGGGSQIQVVQKLTGTGRVFAQESEIPTEGNKVGRGAQRWQFVITPADSHGGSYQLQAKINCGDCYTAYDLRTLPLTQKRITLGKHAGVYHGVDVNRESKVTLTLDAMGRLSGTDEHGCHLSGTLAQTGARNLFDVSMTFSGGEHCHGAMTGVAFFDRTDRTGQVSKAKGSYLYLLGADKELTHGFAMVLAQRSK